MAKSWPGPNGECPVGPWPVAGVAHAPANPTGEPLSPGASLEDGAVSAFDCEVQHSPVVDGTMALPVRQKCRFGSRPGSKAALLSRDSEQFHLISAELAGSLCEPASGMRFRLADAASPGALGPPMCLGPETPGRPAAAPCARSESTDRQTSSCGLRPIWAVTPARAGHRLKPSCRHRSPGDPRRKIAPWSVRSAWRPVTPPPSAEPDASVRGTQPEGLFETRPQHHHRPGAQPGEGQPKLRQERGETLG